MFRYSDRLLAADEPARFHTKSGLLTATRTGDLIEMDFPAEPAEEVDPPPMLLEGLDAEPVYTGRNRMDFLVQLPSERDVRGLDPDFRKIAGASTRGVIVTAVADAAEFDFVSRFFCPAVGIDEDPVTGSAHCCLGPFWQMPLNRDQMTGRQVSERGGTVHVRCAGDRTMLAGHAVTTLRAELFC